MAKNYLEYNLPIELLDSDTDLSKVYAQLLERKYQLKLEGKTPENNEAAARCEYMVDATGKAIGTIVGLRAELLEMKAHLVMLNSENKILHDYMQQHKLKMAMQAGMEEEVQRWKSMKRVYPIK